MVKLWPLIAALVGGVALAIQGPINSELMRHMGQWRAVLVSVLVSLTTILIVLAITRPPGSFDGLAQAPSWSLVGGTLGVVILTAAIIAVPHIGAAATASLVVAGQLLAAAVVDQFGLLNVTVRPLTLERGAGLLLLVLAVILVVRG